MHVAGTTPGSSWINVLNMLSTIPGQTAESVPCLVLFVGPSSKGAAW